MTRSSGTLGSLLTLTSYVALFGASCTAVFDYPAALHESSPALCENGLDDDFDGTADCADDSCDGSCPEVGPQCADGRDNDGDSLNGFALVDAADAECWPSPRIDERCAFVSGGFVESWRRTASEAFPAPDWVTSGDVVRYRPTSELADMIRLLPGEFMESRLPLRGGIEPMGVNVAFELRVGAELHISLVSERLGEVVSATLRTPTTRNDLEAFIETPDAGRTPVSTQTLPGEFYFIWEVDLMGRSGAWQLQLPYDRLTERLPFSPTLPRDEPLFVRFESRGAGSAHVLLGQLSAARDSFDTCGRAFSSPLVNTAALRAAAEGNGTRCVVLAEQAYRSTDGSRWTASRSPIHAGNVGMAWVPPFSRFEGARSDGDAGLRFFASEACDVFRESEPVDLRERAALSSAELVGFDFVPGAEGGERRLWLLGVSASGAGSELVEFASPTGLPASYEVVARWPWTRASWTTGTPLSAKRMGGEVVVLGPGLDPDTIGAYVLAGTGEEVALVHSVDPLIEPSGTTGTFDRFRVRHGRIVPQAAAPAAEDGDEMATLGLPLRVYYFGELLPGEPGYASAPVRSGAGWVDLRFGGSEP